MIDSTSSFDPIFLPSAFQSFSCLDSVIHLPWLSFFPGQKSCPIQAMELTDLCLEMLSALRCAFTVVIYHTAINVFSKEDIVYTLSIVTI